MTPLDLSIKGAIEEFDQGAAVNPIQQAIEALDWCIAEINRDSPSVLNARPVLTSLRSLQKEVEGVEPVGWRHKQYGHIQWRSYDMTPEVCDRYTDSGQWDLLYTADQLRTAVAAALGRGAVPSGWKLVPVEPTPEMRKAAADAWLDCDSKLFLNKAGAAVRAAIAISKESA